MLRWNSNALLWDYPNRIVHSFGYEIRIERRERKQKEEEEKDSEGDCIGQWCWNLWDSKEEIGPEVVHEKEEEKTSYKRVCESERLRWTCDWDEEKMRYFVWEEKERWIKKRNGITSVPFQT